VSDDDHKGTPPALEDNRKPSGPPSLAPIDVERLTDKVYQLMLADARLARSRHER
jgi:hypothetical protein